MKNVFTALLALMLTVSVCYGAEIVVEDPGSVSGASAARLYYPKNISSPTAATTMSAGYTQSLSNVDWLSRALADKGFVVLGLTPNNKMGMVSGWRDMHKGGIAKLKQINSSHNVLKGKIDLGKLQTCGHSKGGGGSLWAASQLGGDLKTAIGMAPFREEFSASDLSAITVATFIQAGGGDTLATNSMTRGEYSGLSGNISRMYVEYSGYKHLAWDSASGSVADRISGDIYAWMRYYMYGDTSYAGTLSNTSGTQMHEWKNLGAPTPASTPRPTPTPDQGSNSGQTGASTTLQAENAVVVSGAVETDHSGYTGSGYVNTDNAAGAYIEFSLTVPQAGAYDLTFYYALQSGDRYASIQVNGSTVVSNIDFNGTGAWTTWGTASATVDLNAGVNTIRLRAEQSGGLANIDKMEVPMPTPAGGCNGGARPWSGGCDGASSNSSSTN